MALFSQDDSDDDETPSMGAAFSGREEPDEETETPSPAEVDNAPETPEVVQPDDANAYAQSPEDQEPQGEAALADQFTPSEGEEGSSAGSYSEPAAPAAGGMTLPAGPVYGDWSADRAALENQYAKESKQNVKPSVGRSIAAALSGAAVAFGSRNPAAGMKVAEGVSSEPARVAQAGWQRQEAPLKQQLANDAAQDAQTQRTYQGQRQAVNDAALNEQRQEHAADYAAHAVSRDATIVPQSMRPVDPNNPLGPWQGTDVKGRVASNLGPPAWFLNSPQGKAAQAEKTISDARAAGHPFSAEQEAVVRSGGKLTVRNPVNIRTPAAGTEEYQGALAAFKQEHGGRGPQTVEEQNQVTQAAKGTLKDNSDAAQTIVDAANGAKQSYAEQYKRNDDGTYTNLATAAIIPGEEFNAKIDGFRTAANVKLQKLGYDVDPHGNLGPTGKQGTPAAAAQPAAGAAPLPQPQQPQTFQYKGSTLTMGQKITIDGKPATFQGIGKTGKIIAGPVSGGQ